MILLQKRASTIKDRDSFDVLQSRVIDTTK